MSKTRETLLELISSLKQQRDELRVKANLGRKEAQDELERLSEKLDELMRKAEPVQNAAEETASNLVAALGLVATEVRDGFQRLRDSLPKK